MHPNRNDMEDDRDELLDYTDEDESPSLSEADEASITVENPENSTPAIQIYEQHTKLEFFSVKLSLVLSSMFLVVLLPMYLETVNVRGDAYTMLFCTNTFTVAILLGSLLGLRHFYPSFKGVNAFRAPLKWWDLFRVSFLYAASGFMVVYSLDRKRVMCHVQDPVKGAALVFSLLYYFFFCRKQMGLQRIFSTTTIIVGLFISVDYGLCDEFKCRGYDREHLTDDSGSWPWRVHTVWTVVYIVGLASFAAFYTFLDRMLLFPTLSEQYRMGISSSLLSTVSRSVSGSDALVNSRSVFGTEVKRKPISALHLAFYVHLVGWVVTVLFGWTDMLDFVGKGNSAESFFNYTANGFICHFYPSQISKHIDLNCANVSLYAWLFVFVYVSFTLSSIRFLILSQSAVYTVATMASSLPLVCVWWALFRLAPIEKGLMQWAPSVSGELICALLGLPVVLLGLYLLCKSHFMDSQICRLKVGQASVSSTA